MSHIGRPPWISVKQRKTHIETKGETMDWDRLEADISTAFSAQNNFQHFYFTVDDSTASVCGPVKLYSLSGGTCVRGLVRKTGTVAEASHMSDSNPKNNNCKYN